MSDGDVADILSPTSPSMANAVFGSARPRRPSTPKSPPAELSQSSQPRSQPQTPVRKDRPLPPIPGPAQVRSPRTTRTGLPPRARPAQRPDSPDVETMIARTPRPRRKSSATFNPPLARTRSNSSMAVPSSWKGAAKSKEEDNDSIISDYGALVEKEDESEDEKEGNGGGSESDSSIDIHTPLPHLMFRDGLLSPRSKLLPGGGTPTLSMYLHDDEASAVNRANSVLSLASTAGSTMTKSGIYRDPRDTQRRKVRHRDQQLLRAGMGLTTGLGWSDSEDEDAPSLLTRRLINTNIERQPSVYSTTSRAPSQLSKSTSAGNLSHPPPSFSPALRPGSRPLSRSISTSFSQYRLSAADTESVTSVDAARPTRSRTQSNASASSIVSSGSRDSSSAPQSVTSSQTTPSRTAVPRPLRLPQTAGMGAQPSVTRSTSVTESRPPVASASAKIAGVNKAQTATRQRTRTLSNPGSRPMNMASPRSVAASRIVPPRSVSTAIMAPVRSISTSISAVERSGGSRSHDPLSEFPLPPSLTSSPGLVRPSVNTQIRKPSDVASPVPRSAPPTAQVLNTVGTGPRPRPRTGTGMVYRNSSYSSYYETSRISRTSVASSAKEVGVI
ncbi:hypothetical protein K466DRAFT_217006 [Polyporus arcularius HHB13444]|uniref:Uncharacterized protein n=1 Tax=Polyporus arcularius HHB13444 TaxID=1314778 RepID=A0A5C3P5C2_9APHY|nr:hypothetical protein K466DRAFT_217006 [Polyporus arcularius HHB13444]